MSIWKKNLNTILKYVTEKLEAKIIDKIVRTGNVNYGYETIDTGIKELINTILEGREFRRKINLRLGQKNCAKLQPNPKIHTRHSNNKHILI